ncbi:MAG: response regulator transcription factor [Candidatus Caldatribacterium sp.]|uniref:response regulator n=1 Tax=Candidatus Caldatribacterium sp. TaxID=2282143 RepID=UPI0029979C6E|nr:response regulator transcription factor [Candidatus Caldatribacterium sp.]MCX7729945.1 response regulator transcription factor [Candidatus Caldatribacterium sp.]MDW8080636.1 response regulator transcription factor [Candidatus Calescibacterium sp.]
MRVALVDDHEIVLVGLEKLLAENGYEVVAKARNFQEALRIVPPALPDIVLLDFHIPGGNGLSLLRELRKQMPRVTFLMLTVEEDEEIILRAVQEGARGYIIKHSPPERLLESLRACVRGEVLLGEEIYGKIFEHLRRERHLPPHIFSACLSVREREVAELIVSGKSNKEIAALLGISESTVKNHITSILKKLGAQDRVEIVLLWAKQNR